MKKITLSIFIILISLNIFAQIDYSIDIKEKPAISLCNSDTNHVIIKLSDFKNILKEGLPNLPVKYFNFIIPYNSEVVDIKVNCIEEKSIKLNKPITIGSKQVPIGNKNHLLDSTLNRIDENVTMVFPENKVELVNEGFYDYNNHIITVAVCPFEYSLSTFELTFYNKLSFHMITEKRFIKDTPISRSRKAMTKKIYKKSIEKFVENSEQIKLYQLPIKKTKTSKRALNSFPYYDYIIITSEELSHCFNSFLNWKRRKGVDIGIVTLSYIYSNYASGDIISGINDNAGSIRQFLYDAYSNGTTFCLLGGDNTVVPIRYGWASNNTINNNYIIPCDYYFSDFNGDWNVDGDACYGEPTEDNPDFVPEIFIGRLMCSTQEHISNWTRKLIVYESNPGNGNTSYLTKALYTEADHMQQYNWAYRISRKLSFLSNKILKETYNGIHDYNSVGLPQFPRGSDIINEFNNYYGFVSFMGHGSPQNIAVATKLMNDYPKERIYTYESEYPDLIGGALENMRNEDHPNIYYSISCSNVPFDDFNHSVSKKNIGECYTTEFKSGGVAFLGNTRYGWINSSLYLFEHFADEITKGNTHIGIAEANSIILTSNNYLKYSHNLIGCPETEMWTLHPYEFENVFITQTGTTVNVNTGVLSDCRICVMSILDNGESYWEVKNGSAATFYNVTEPYYVTITKPNYIPYLYPDDIKIQNHTFTENTTIIGNNISVGYNVDNSKTYGTVKINPGVHVTFIPKGTFQIGTSSSTGTHFELLSNGTTTGTFEVIR